MRIAVVLVLRHGREEAEARLVDVTRRACEAAGAPERFDEPLTRRWAVAVADALTETGARDAGALLAARPELFRSDLLGQPAWRRSTAT